MLPKVSTNHQKSSNIYDKVLNYQNKILSNYNLVYDKYIFNVDQNDITKYNEFNFDSNLENKIIEKDPCLPELQISNYDSLKTTSIDSDIAKSDIQNLSSEKTKTKKTRNYSMTYNDYFNNLDSKNLKTKCDKLKIDIDTLVSRGKIHIGSGYICYVHYLRNIGYIKLDNGEFVRFHKIDFKKYQYLVTVMYCFKIKLSVIYSSNSDHMNKSKKNNELLLVDMEYLNKIKHVMNEQNINSKNYWRLLGNVQGLPLVMRIYYQSKLKQEKYNKLSC
eukprot:Mrub_06125.p1 GENE.Mrub_06125~~Mrub_06125.p1  ORF type:complete len:318 (+),score=25.78 Mrub_06125:131-955(+)